MTQSAGKKKKPVKPTNEVVFRIKNFLKSKDFAKTRGVFDILFAAFLFVSIVSYFVSKGELPNWCGGVGYWFADLFVKHTFGFAAVGFCFLFVVRGFRLMERPLLPQGRTNLITYFWMLWLSVTLGYADHLVKGDNGIMELYSGTVGTQLSQMLFKAIKIGLPVLLAFLAFAFLLLVHHVRVKLPKLPVRENDGVQEKKREGLAIRSTVEPKSDDEKADEDTERMGRFKAFLQNMKEKREQAKAEIADARQEEGEEFVSDIAESETENEEATRLQEDREEENPTIDDEFERINARARQRAEEEASLQTAADNALQDETPVAKNEGVTFTIIRPEEMQASAVEEEELFEEDPSAVSLDESGEPCRGSLDTLYDPHLDLPRYEMPDTDMLQDWERSNVEVTKEELTANKEQIECTLNNYGIKIDSITAQAGPTVTLYEIKPAAGVRISKIKNLEDDIALSLSALGIRIIAPIPGKGTVGIEVPNSKPQIVSMKTMLDSAEFRPGNKMQLPVALGKDINGKPFVTDLAKMPHLLMAGATGTGKSVGLNAVISSLLYRKHPSELKFVMVDPKKVELSLYNKIERHYLAKLPDSDEGENEPIITDVKRVVRTLNSLCIEMDTRYDLLKRAQVRKITEYNDKVMHRRLVLNPDDPKGHRYLPYIVLVIDEFADLIMTAGKEVEMPICRLAQLARAVGIHLIIATQRPTTNIITGTIKANFPARIAFRVTSAIDSRTILDTGGAQRLIGRGDMLISLSGADLIRCQCALIETEEIESLVNFIGDQDGYSEDMIFTLPEYLDENDAPNKDFDAKMKDEFFNDAARLVVSSQFGSTSLLQRKLQLGYARAGRIIDQLEGAGIVGPYNGSKAREVLVKNSEELEDILRNL